ncbi:E3 SUMO-protein ligase ZBED1-like [Nematolebias whitei]|uniref:E3 SUMO-protein ligase ZBED1-like n=2 Tax=Nematolebias whitei TaxID=451745 RepID=UPI001897F13A|nr:E3 SUMO-protein ligase ZBED1-like [Nematolebias whitei]
MDVNSSSVSGSPRKIFNTAARQKSKVWNVFGFYKKDGKLDKNHAICKLCRAPLKYTGSTTNLDQHATRKHREEYGELLKPHNNEQEQAAATQRATGNVITKFYGQLGDSSSRAKDITASITRFIAKGLWPYNIVEGEGFQDLIHTLEPRYKIPSRQHITNTCMPALYAQVKSQVEKELAHAERVAITTDAWTSCSTESYVTITVHYISPDWKLNVHVLQTRAFKGSHTGKNIGALLKQACVDWNLLDKDPALVTDNATNMVLAGVEAEMTPHLMCFAHTINLATQKAFKVDTVARLLGRVRKAVAFFHRSVRAAEILQEKQKQLALPSHKLIQDVSTRWNSSHDMLERFFEQHPAISAALMSRDLRKGEEVNTLKDKDFCDIEDIVKLMAPVKLVTTSMSEDKRPTLSMILPVKAKLKKNFEPSDEDSVLIREMKQAFKNDLEKRYTGLEHLFHTAAALDPRFKSLPFLSNHDAERTFTSISAEAASLHHKVTGGSVQRGPVQTDPCQSEPANGDPDVCIDVPQTQDEHKGLCVL